MSDLVEKMVAILADDIGDMVARASVEMYIKQMGVTDNAIGPEHVPELADKLGPGLSVFVGSNKAEILVTRLKALAKGHP
ncbi:MAG: hypothetical protein QNJ97_03550 [Myxococcota bacterium]|nr:hypothetical protein [Myxococcota bacterium]